MALPAAPARVTDRDRSLLSAWLSSASTSPSTATRVRIVLRAAEGLSNHSIARELHVSRPTVRLWRRRFQADGPFALSETAPGRGRKRSIPAARERAIVDAARFSGPGAWSCRTMARAQGVGPTSVHRIWSSHGLSSRRPESPRSDRPRPAGVVGIYLSPPYRAVFLTLSRSPRRLPTPVLAPGGPGSRGDLVAFLERREAALVGEPCPRQRRQQFLRFLRSLEGELVPGQPVEAIVDWGGSQRHLELERWLRLHLGFRVHVATAATPWPELVRRWLGELAAVGQRGGSRLRPSLAALRDATGTVAAGPSTWSWRSPVLEAFSGWPPGKVA